MSSERIGGDPISQLAELVVHRIHALKQKEKFKKFQPLRKSQNPYAKDASPRSHHNQKYRMPGSHSEGRRPVDQDPPREKKSIIVTEENVTLPRIPFHQRSFEQKYRDELREFKKMHRHFRYQEEKQRSQSRILDEVINRQLIDEFPYDMEFSTFNYTMEESTGQEKNRQPSVISKISRFSFISFSKQSRQPVSDKS